MSIYTTTTSTQHGTTTSEKWNGEQAFNSELCKGNGFIIEGQLVQQRMHLVTGIPQGNSLLPGRYLALQLTVTRVCKRTYGADGKELIPEQTKTQITPRGYLTREKSVKVSNDEALGSEAASKVLLPVCNRPGFYLDSQKQNLHPNKQFVFEFWADAASFVTNDFKTGQVYRLKTRGDTPIVESATRIDVDGSEKSLSYFAGETNVQGSWTDKIAKAKAATATHQQQSSTSISPSTTQDDEWA